MRRPSRAIFLDRDGTLMEEVHYCRHPADVRAMPGAAEALARAHLAGYLAIVITNQSGIASGKIPLTAYRQVEAELARQLEHGIDAVYFSPDAADSSPRRKPGIGMVEEAARDHHISLPESWFIGDKDIDIQCGKSAGCRTILVLTGYGRQHLSSAPDFVANDVAEAIDLILHQS